MANSWSFQPPLPGGQSTAPAPAQPAESQPAPTGDKKPSDPFGGMSFFLILALPLLLIFLMTRSQNKKQKQLEASLKNGDRVVTQSGIFGKIIDLSEQSNRVKLEIAPGVNIQVLKSTIQGVDPGDTKAGEVKPADKKA